MIVLKLGGSLLSKNALLPFLELASKDGKGQVIIVPGGGVFADQVRLTQKQWRYDDRTAHYMAILAMQQMALLFQGLCPELLVVNKVAAILPDMQQQNVVIWSPLASELDSAEIPANWDITSDTLAAWLAVHLSIDQLMLVKSCEHTEIRSIEQMSAQGIVDHSFANFVDNQSLTIDYISYQQISTLATKLKKHV